MNAHIDVKTLLYVLSLLMFALAAAGWPPPKGNLIAGGLLFWELATIV